jgi:hypothetical protein
MYTENTQFHFVLLPQTYLQLEMSQSGLCTNISVHPGLKKITENQTLKHFHQIVNLVPVLNCFLCLAKYLVLSEPHQIISDCEFLKLVLLVLKY